MAFIARAIKSETKRRDPYIRTQALSVLRKYERAMKKDYEKVIQTWDGDKPIVDGKVSFPRVSPDMSVWAGMVNDGSFGWRKFNWLNKGTALRWAVVSDDWVSKTWPGRIAATSGDGYIEIAGRAMIDAGYQAEPGIEARDFDGMIREKHLKDFQKDMKAAVARGIRRSAKAGG